MKEVKDTLKRLGKPAVAMTVIMGLFLIGFCGAVILKLVSGPKADSVSESSLAALSGRLGNAIEAVGKRNALEERAKVSTNFVPRLSEDVIKSAPPPEPVLKGVASNKGKTKVFLNDRILSVGDELEGRTVVGIKKDNVTIRDKDGHENTISLEIE